MRARLLLLSVVAGCAAGIGGPVDRRYPDEQRPVATVGPVTVVSIVNGEHYAGGGGCTSHAESGAGCDRARAGDRFRAAIVLELDGKRVAEVASRSSIASRDEARALVSNAKVESCARDGRTAVRATLDGAGDLYVVEPAKRRWWVADGGRCDDVIGKEPFAPHDL